MADLKTVMEKLEDIPEQYRDLYKERDGKFELVGIVGVKTQGDVDRLTEGLTKEREDHKATKAKLKAFEGLDPEDVRTKLDGWDELNAKAEANEDKFDKEKLDELATARVVTATAPLERELAALKETNAGQAAEIEEFKGREVRRTISDAVRTATTDAKVLPTAIDDVLLLAERVFEIHEDDGRVVTRDSVGCTPGVEADIWLGEIQESRPHWWPVATGGGARGGGGGPQFTTNPWSRDQWNLTEQGQVLRGQGREKADQMAKAAGSHVGAAHPPAAPKKD